MVRNPIPPRVERSTFSIVVVVVVVVVEGTRARLTERRSGTRKTKSERESARCVLTQTGELLFADLFSSAYVLARRSGHPSRAAAPLLLSSSRSSLLPRLFFLLESLHFPSWREPLCTRSCPPCRLGFRLHSSISLDFKALKQVSKSRPRKNHVPSFASLHLAANFFFVLLVVLLIVVAAAAAAAAKNVIVNRRFAAFRRRRILPSSSFAQSLFAIFVDSFPLLTLRISAPSNRRRNAFSIV